MATTFQLKRSSVQGKQPNIGDIQVGELAVNLADGILYSKNTAGNIIVVGSSTTSNVTEGSNLYFTNTRAIGAFTAGENIGIEANGLITATSTAAGGGGANVTVSSSPPGSPVVGDVWVDSDTAIYYTYINDGDSDQWVEIAATTIYTNDAGGGAVDLSSVSSNILPDSDVTYDIGSPSLRFKDIYLSGNTIVLGTIALKDEGGTLATAPVEANGYIAPSVTTVSGGGNIIVISRSTNVSINTVLGSITIEGRTSNTEVSIN